MEQFADDQLKHAEAPSDEEIQAMSESYEYTFAHD